MTTTEERMQILKMIEEGKITPAEGAKLLTALGSKKGGKGESQTRSGAPRWFRIRVTSLDSGKNKVNVNIPMGLVNVGIKMGAKFAPNIEGLDLEEIMEAIREGARGKIVDVVDEDDGERVEIFIE